MACANEAEFFQKQVTFSSAPIAVNSRYIALSVKFVLVPMPPGTDSRALPSFMAGSFRDRMRRREGRVVRKSYWSFCPKGTKQSRGFVGAS